jgi:uncharacterized protein YhbP (UPF0306 family)
MKTFPTAVISYIESNRILVLAVQMPDGSPHAATVHYAYDAARNLFIFETYREYRKMEAFASTGTTRASLVIGSSESDMRTLQIDGTARLLNDSDEGVVLYMKTFPEKQGKYEAQKLVFFACTPTWWRFTDWTHADGKRVETSE